jgi:hypothetical protein
MRKAKIIWDRNQQQPSRARKLYHQNPKEYFEGLCQDGINYDKSTVLKVYSRLPRAQPSVKPLFEAFKVIKSEVFSIRREKTTRWTAAQRTGMASTESGKIREDGNDLIDSVWVNQRINNPSRHILHNKIS